MTTRWNEVRGWFERSARLAAIAVSIGLGGAASAFGQAVPLNVFDLPPGATVTITFEVDVDSPLGPCANSISNQGRFFGDNFPDLFTDDPDVGGAANPTVTGLDVVDLAITKTDGSATEVPGTPVTYTIVVSNAGPSPAVAASVVDTFPGMLTGVSWSCAPGPGASCTAGPVAGNINDLVNVPVGSNVTYTVNATVAASASGTLVNTATVAAAGNQVECNLANNSATDTDTLTPQVDLSITKTDGLLDVDAGSPTSYTIVVNNSGPSDALGATVADLFPADLQGVTWSCSASPGPPASSCGAGGAGNINDVVTVRVGGMLTYTVNATVDGAASGTLSNTATVTAPGGTTDTNGANNSATDTTTVNQVANLSIHKTDGVTTAVPGMSVTYTILASNAGPATATAASVADTFPAVLTCSWTCVATPGSSCTAGPIAGNIADSVTLISEGSATYTAVCDIADNASGSLVNTATISGGGVSDTDPTNNSFMDTDTLLGLDFGDAPDGSLAAPSGYPTLLVDNGARHGIDGSLKMGSEIDTETNGQPTVDADGDDTTGVDDEDGVSLPATVVACDNVTVTVNVSAANSKLDAWIDFNADGDFTDPGEQIFTTENMPLMGNNVKNFTVPCTAVPAPKTFARFRLSTAGGLASNDVAADGEVEDYKLEIKGLDFGDAPDPAYPTLFASNGARHVVAGSGPILGAIAPDADPDGQPTANATGDDANGVDDEDGVIFPAPLVPGTNADVTVTRSAPGFLSAWIDFDQDGSFAQVGDKIIDNLAVSAGTSNLSFAVPPTANTNTTLIARFRIDTAGGLSFNGLAADGEVEDHTVSVVAVADVAITKTDGAANEVPGTPVTYTITVTNSGPDPVTGATVADTFPGILTGVSWSCAPNPGPAASCTAGPIAGNINDSVDLAAGGSVTYTATGNIAPTATGNLVNTATVTSPPAVFDPVPGNNSATDTDTLTPQTDLAVTKTDGSAVEIPGTPVTYTIVVTNNGPSTATGVTVTDNFPAALTGCSWTSLANLGASGNTPGPVAGNVAESGITMPPGSSITYTATCNVDPAARGTLVNTASAASATTDPVPGNNSATDTDTLVPEVDLVVTKVESIDPVIAGSGVGNLTYTITVANSGPSTATSVTVSEVLTLPAGVTLVSATPSQGAFVSPTWTVGTLAPAGSATLTVVLTAAAATASGTDTICDTATLTGAAETLINTGNDSDTECTSVGRQVDMVVSKVESIDPVVAGSGAGNLTYTVTVINNGPSNASGITLSEVVTVPAGVTVDSVTPSQGGFASPTWTVGSLVSGASATLTVVLTATSAATPGTNVICDTATLTAVNEPQVATGNESDTECTSITVSADLAITKTDDADPPPAGNDLTYTITVTNNGPSDATGVVVTDPLPAATTYVSDTCGASNVPPWTWNVGNLANGASIACDVVVSINPTPPASISNTATVTATTNDAVPGNNSDTEETTLDAISPEVTLVASVQDTGDGELEECETANVEVSQLLLTFSEEMNDPVGNTDPADVTNPANYLLLLPGPDLTFDTTLCGPLADDDESVVVSAVTYSNVTNVATVASAGALPDGLVRLHACGTLQDLAGNQLDGDGDDNGGDDFVRGFRVDASNLFANGHFDCTIDDWTVVTSTAGEITWAAPDADASPHSGSAAVTNLMPGIDTRFELNQCAAVGSGAQLTLGTKFRLAAAVGVSLTLQRNCEFFSGAACAAGSLGTISDVFIVGDTGGTWLTRQTNLTSPAASQSARCSIFFDTATGASFNGALDGLSLLGQSPIFADGFETGDTSQWSDCEGTGCP